MNTDQPSLLRMLACTKFAEGLPDTDLECLCRAARLIHIPSDQVIFREGTVEDEIFVISSGHVRLSMNVPGRGEVPFLTAGPGDLVGWSGAIGEGRMTATATTTENTTLIAMSGHRLRELCRCKPEVGYVLMKRIAQVLSQRLLSTRLQLLDLFAQAGD